MQGDTLDRVFFIHSGKVKKIHKIDAGGKRTNCFGASSRGNVSSCWFFSEKGTYPAHAEILETAELIVTPIADF
ncbi:hypothetical protein GCM10020331_000030 [Ectobacillus funiculus]